PDARTARSAPRLAANTSVVRHAFTRRLRADIARRERPRAYLCQAVRNAAMNHRRARSREVELDGTASWLETPRGCGASSRFKKLRSRKRSRLIRLRHAIAMAWRSCGTS